MQFSIEKKIGGGSFNLIIRDKLYKNVEDLSYAQRDALQDFLHAFERDIREDTKAQIRSALGISK
jgi:hypothetical protein